MHIDYENFISILYLKKLMDLITIKLDMSNKNLKFMRLMLQKL